MPVPFCLATSRISSISRLPVFSSCLEKMSVVDLHQISVQFAFVPCVIHVVHFIVVQAQASFHQVVGLGQKLHHTVLDAVVDHLHEVTGRSGTEPGLASIAIDLCC